MRIIEQHRPQTILALLQAGTVLVGSIGIGAMLKALGYSDIQGLPWILVFVRNWGFLLLAIPLAWVLVTIWMEFHHTWYSKRYTILSGLLLIASLVWFFISVAARAGSILVSMGNQ